MKFYQNMYPKYAENMFGVENKIKKTNVRKIRKK